MRLRSMKVLALAVVGVMLSASGAAAATDFTAPCTTAETACLAQRLTAVEAWIEANDTDAPAPSPSPTTAPATWDGSIRYGSAAAGKATPLAVTITSPSGTQGNKVVYVEAWQNNVRKADVFVEGRDLTGTTTQNLSLPALPSGVYELR